MCENFKKIIAVMSIAIMAMSAGLPVFAKEGSGFDNLSPEEVYQYLLDRGVSSEQLNLLNDEILESAMRQAEANDFTDAQVQQYIEGQISIMIDSQIISHEEAVLSEDGSTFITSHGEYPNLLQRYKSRYTGECTANGVMSNSFVTLWSTRLDAMEQRGNCLDIKGADDNILVTVFAASSAVVTTVFIHICL